MQAAILHACEHFSNLKQNREEGILSTGRPVNQNLEGVFDSRASPEPSPSEGKLLEAARNGDACAFEALVVPERRRILRIAQRIMRDYEDAEDVVQNALVKAYRHISGFRGNELFSTWLIRIVTNEALMKLRSGRRNREVPLDQATEPDKVPKQIHLLDLRPTPEEDYLDHEVRDVLRKAIARLDEKSREIFQLRYVSELSVRDSADLLGLPVSTVKARLHRARRRLSRIAHLMLAGRRDPRSRSPHPGSVTV